MDSTTLDRNPAEVYQETFVRDIATPVSVPLLAAAALRPGERVLDVACGTGLLARRAAELVGPTGRVSGLDVTAEMLAVARATPGPAEPEIEWVRADAAAMPLPDAAFDVVLCQLGLMFMPDKRAALAEMRRVLAPRGRLALNTPGAIQPVFEILAQGLARHIDPDLGGFVRTVFSVHDPEALAALAVAAGYRDVEATSAPITLRLPPPGRFLWEYVGSTPLSPVVARAGEEARAALERDVVARWEEHTVDGRLVVEQPEVTLLARTGAEDGSP